jgi:Glycosyl hydrolase family 67 C-terminus
MRRWIPSVLALCAFSAGLTAALAFERVYTIQIRERPADPLAGTHGDVREETGRAPLTLRLVDSGGVGIPLDNWGENYSHDRRAFREAILSEAPYISATAFERIERDWHAYVERMREYGNNAIAVPMLLELIDFDRVRASGPSNTRIYDAASSYRARHREVRRAFGPLFEWTDRHGMQIFLEADMLSLTAPLAEHLRRLAPDDSAVGIDTSRPEVWDVYRAGLEELFEKVPAIKGLVLRFGEGGSLYNTDGWPYRSEMALRTPASVRAMLRGLLPAFEKSGRTLVLRSWTVGVGRLGRLHIDPRVYDAVLGDIDSPALIVSTKFTAGDFFSYLPLNPTLAHGRHRRLVEFQAKPEFEGFSTFPDFLGDEYARALRSLRAANPHVVGSFVFTQNGGPLRAGPRTLYPLHGVWLWTDANVFVASRLASDPGADVTDLARQWAARTFGDDPRITDAVSSVLIDTRKAVLEGFYIRPFAAREVRVPGLELPPLMWIFEWDMLGGWHSLLSLVYQGTRGGIDAAIAEGHSSTEIVRRARARLQAVFAAAGAEQCASCDAAIRSLEYQESVFAVLAAWRHAFLSYYRWLDTGAADAWAHWRAGRAQFEAAATRHTGQFGHDLDFPAFDLTSATRAIVVAERSATIRSLAFAIVIVLIVLAGIGNPLMRRWRIPRGTRSIGSLMWTTAVTPWRLSGESVNLRSAIAVTGLALASIGFLAGTLTGFAAPWIEGGSVLLFAVVAVAFESSADRTSRTQGRGRLLVASVGPLIPGAMILLSLIVYAGPLGFWYWFWTSPIFQVVVVTIAVAMPLWAAAVILVVRLLEGWRAPMAGWLTAAGAGLLVLTTLLPAWPVALRSLDSPLNLAPATDTMLFALQTYAGVRVELGGLFYAAALLLAAGYVARLTSSREKTTI